MNNAMHPDARTGLERLLAPQSIALVGASNQLASIGGMLFATFLGLLLIPVFFVVVRRILGDKLNAPSPAHHLPHHE